MDWFLYDDGLRHERVKSYLKLFQESLFTNIFTGSSFSIKKKEDKKIFFHQKHARESDNTAQPIMHNKKFMTEKAHLN